MKTTFLNCRKEDRKAFRERGRKHLQGRSNNFKLFQKYGSEPSEVDNHPNWDNLLPDAQLAIKAVFDEIGSFYSYGLSIDYQLPEGRKAGYLRYQLSWGGPSDEIRFYFAHGARQCHKIEYVFLDWGTGVGFDVTNEDWAQWLFDWFNESQTVEIEVQKALEKR